MIDRLPTHHTMVFATLVVSLLAGLAVGADETYDFQSLTLNQFLDGQDAWFDQPQQGMAYVGQDDSPANGTKVVRVLPTVAFDEPAYLTRVNNGSFGFQSFSGNDQNAGMQFDVNGEYLGLFALGHDVDGDGMLKAIDGEIGPLFGVRDRLFRVQQANQGAAFEVAFGPGNAGYDWYRIRLQMDFTANNGVGAGALSYRNLSDGDPEFIPVDGLQNVNLGLDSLHPEAGPAAWDAMWLHMLNNGSKHTAADNLIPHVEVQVAGDVNQDGVVDIDDLFAVLAAWGSCPNPPAECPADVDDNGEVNIDDLFAVLANWS